MALTTLSEMVSSDDEREVTMESEAEEQSILEVDVVSDEDFEVVSDDDESNDNEVEDEAVSDDEAEEVEEEAVSDDESEAEENTSTFKEDENAATGSSKKQRSNKELIAASDGMPRFLLMSIAIISAGVLLKFFSNNHGAAQPPLPTTDLQSFVLNERSRNNLEDVQDFQTDGFHRYAQSFCGAAPSFEKAQANLRLQLSDLPLDVQDKVVKRALVEEITQKNTMQDSTSKLTSDGRVATFMAYWSTVYNPNSETAKYDTCIMVAGIEIEAAEVVANYKETSKKVIIGSQPCNCGYAYCEVCPIVDTQVTRTPIFKRHSLSLKKQDDLHRWLVKSAVDSAEAIVGRAAVIGDETAGELGWEKDEFETS